MDARALFLATSIVLIASSSGHAENFGADLLSACAVDQLKTCKLTNRTIKSDQLAQYAKAFECLKNGSSSGDKFDLGIPLPDGGQLGIGLNSNATHSTQVCKEEIKKIDSASFLKTYAETFDQECGRTLAGQYQQCVTAATTLSQPPGIQSLKCSAVQSEKQITILTRYVPAAMEGPEQYKIKSVSGLDGISCDTDAYAGVNQYSLMSCSLPAQYSTSQLVIKLGNTVSCSVPVRAERRVEIDTAKKFTCSGVYNSLEGFTDRFPTLFRVATVGLCDMCLSENLSTAETDQRTLENRLSGCAAWALQSAAGANTNFCSVKPAPQPGYFGSNLPGFGNPFPGPGTPSTDAPPPVLPTAKGTELDQAFAIGNPNTNPDGTKWAASLCNGRREGEIVQLHGKQWKTVPIDYLSSSEGQNSSLKPLIDALQAHFAKN